MEDDRFREDDLATAPLRPCKQKRDQSIPRSSASSAKIISWPYLCQQHQVDPQHFGIRESGVKPRGFRVSWRWHLVSCSGGSRADRRILAGINWSATPPPAPPFSGLETYSQYGAGVNRAPVVVVAHLAIPRPTFRDRGKQALALPYAIEGALEEQSLGDAAVDEASGGLSEPSGRCPGGRGMPRQERAQYPSIKEAAYQLMRQAYRPPVGRGGMWRMPGRSCMPHGARFSP